MRTHLPEKVQGTNLRDIKSGGGRVIYAPDCPIGSGCRLALSALARSDTCTLRVMSLAVFFSFILFIDYFLFESLNILQQ